MSKRGSAVIVAVVCVLSMVGCGTPERLASKPGPELFPRAADQEATIKAAGLPLLTAEGNKVHYHAHLDVSVNDKRVNVPLNIGIAGPTAISPLHTHDITGLVHIESESDDKFTVGQFFTQWGVKLDASCIATHCTDANNELTAYVNGTQFAGDPATIVFKAHDEIFIRYGLKGAVANVPGTYVFPEGS